MKNKFNLVIFSKTINKRVLLNLISITVSLARGRNANPWPNNVVPYERNPTHPNWKYIEAAINEYNKNTNVVLREKIDADKAYVRWIYDTNGGNWSDSIGYSGERIHTINQKGGYRVAHELGHVLGFIHEHQREDRDDNIIIVKENFDKNNMDWINSQMLAIEESVNLTIYDVGSIMHYWCSAGGFKYPWYEKLVKRNFNGESITMIYKADPSLKFDTPEKLSPKDIVGINTFYPKRR